MSQIHELYLRFSREQLAGHFIGAGTGDHPDRHVKYYENSAASAKRLSSKAGQFASAAERSTFETYGFQMEKDERFWVADALMGLYHSQDRVTAFERLLGRSSPAVQPTTSWRELLGDGEDLQLFFEVYLPAPQQYRAWLRENADTVILLPWLRDLVRSRPRVRLEGPTKADAMLVNARTGFAAVFEAKVLSDVSTHTRFDPARNQIARSLDVLLDRHDGYAKLAEPLRQRDPGNTYFFLLTPERFRRRPETRLYGSLVDRYRRDVINLEEHLPHRRGNLDGVNQRLGWLTWEDCVAVESTCCPWLTADR